MTDETRAAERPGLAAAPRVEFATVTTLAGQPLVGLTLRLEGGELIRFAMPDDIFDALLADGAAALRNRATLEGREHTR